MKVPFFVVTGIIVLAAAGCRKEQPYKNNQTSGSDTLPGVWEYRAYWGGFTGGGTAEPGNGNTYTFTGTQFRHYENHMLVDSGTYSLATTRGPENGNPISAIVFNNSDTTGFTIGNDTLTLDPRAPWYDGIARQYVRIADAEW